MENYSKWLSNLLLLSHAYHYQVIVTSNYVHNYMLQCINVYMQVQCQIFCTKSSYCDFVLWTKEEVHMERIYPDEQFWLENLALVEHFFTTAILPELLGKFFSRHPALTEESHTEANVGNQQETSTEGTSQCFCYCDGPDEGHMVGCDNPTCKYQWFHLKCSGLKSEPKSRQWYCQDCRKQQTKRHKKSKN